MVRGSVACSLGMAAALFAMALGVGCTGSWLAGSGLGLAGGGLTGWLIWSRRCFELDAAAFSRGFALVSAAATVVALVQLARLTAFIVSPSRAELSLIPSSPWEVRHSCVSAYYVAARAAGDSPNVYDGSLYTAPDDDPGRIRKPLVLDSFNVDVYEYPPPFLTLPRGLRFIAPEFLSFRMAWFGLNGLVVLWAMVLVARSLGPAAGTRALLLSPFVLTSVSTLSCLQKGNVQGMVIALAMLALLLFERRRFLSGGALLAFATVSKLFPGLLVVYLIARRRWCAVRWTAGLAVAFAILTALDIGAASYAAFIEHLPGLIGGEAFPAFRNPAALAINQSVPGIVFKLKLLGVPAMSFGTSKVVGWLYTAVAATSIFFVGRRRLAREDEPLAWLSILTLATLRSPFLPQAYAAFPPVWLLTLLAAKVWPNAKAMWLCAAAWVALQVYWPIDWPISPKLLAAMSSLPQLVTLGVVGHVVRRALRAARAEDGAAAAPADVPAL